MRICSVSLWLLFTLLKSFTWEKWASWKHLNTFSYPTVLPPLNITSLLKAKKHYYWAKTVEFNQEIYLLMWNCCLLYYMCSLLQTKQFDGLSLCAIIPYTWGRSSKPKVTEVFQVFIYSSWCGKMGLWVSSRPK